MNTPEATTSERHPEVLVAPTVTFLAVVGLLVIARFYDALPVQASDCGFRERFGIPCVACGGTRSMQALATGDVRFAIQFHPAAAIGVFLSFLWFASGIRRYLRKAPPRNREAQKRLLLRGLAIAALILFTNWIYLVFFLP